MNRWPAGLMSNVLTPMVTALATITAMMKFWNQAASTTAAAFRCQLRS